MKRSKYAYCESCDKDVEYDIIEEVRTGSLKGVSFTYVFKKAICKECGEEVSPVLVGNENYISFIDAYKAGVKLLKSSKKILNRIRRR